MVHGMSWYYKNTYNLVLNNAFDLLIYHIVKFEYFPQEENNNNQLHNDNKPDLMSKKIRYSKHCPVSWHNWSRVEYMGVNEAETAKYTSVHYLYKLRHLVCFLWLFLQCCHTMGLGTAGIPFFPNVKFACNSSCSFSEELLHSVSQSSLHTNDKAWSGWALFMKSTEIR